MNEKKKAVVLLVPGFPSNEQDTTCLPFLQQFCLSFSQVRPDIELSVISFQYPFNSGHYLWNGIKVYSAGGRSHKFNRLNTWIWVFVQFLKIRKEYDVSVINSFWMTECAFAGQWLARAFNIRHVVYLIGQDALKSNKYLKLIDFSNMEIIAMSESLVNHFYESTGYKIHHIIPAGIDMNKIKPTNEKRTIDILGVGALIPLKGYLLFTEIINELKKDFPNIKSCIIGKGEQEQALRENTKVYGLENNLKLIGEISHTEVFSYMQRSKIFLHTSAYEGQSTVIMEALASGLTIVCFDIGRADVKERIWVCKDKVEMLSKLRELLSSELTYESVVLLTNDDMVRAFLKVYGNILMERNNEFASNLFYNSVADEYNNQINSDVSNEVIRNRIKDYFLSTLTGKRVLDFGGGTGMDLRWLTANDFDICFCEPSEKMSAIAMKSVKSKEVAFLDIAKTDFRQWNATFFPGKFNAVLANFAVINSIQDIKLLFQKLHDVIIPGGHIIATLLDTTSSGILKYYLKNFLLTTIKNTYPVLMTQHSANRHIAYLHTPKRLKEAMPSGLSCIKIESLSGSGFMLFHCQKSL